MRVELLTPRVAAKPGSSCQVELEVFNTGEVIDSVTSRVVGHSFGSQQLPPTLSLFPESGDRLTVSFTIPEDFAAGPHSVPIEVASTFQQDDVAVANLALDVEPVVSATLGLTPSDITAGKKAKFAVEVTNDGNVPIDLTLTGNDLERVLRFRFEPLFVHVEPGETTYASGVATGKRPFFGSSIARNLTVLAWGNDLDLSTPGRFVQKPRIPRGFLTFLALGGVIAIWAAVIILGAGLVLAKDEPKKTVPATFLIGNVGFDATTVAGSMTGTVTSDSGLPVERITVEAWLVGKDGASELQVSTATEADGTWELPSAKPGTYHLKFAAPGFQPVWYPSASGEAGAQDVKVDPVAATKDLAVTIQGNPGSITGAIVASETAILLAEVQIFKVVDEVPETEPVITGTTEPETGRYVFGALPTPAVYEVRVDLAGFDPQTARVELGGGENEVVNTMNMLAGLGNLSGTVVDAEGNPLGGVTVTLSGGGQDLSVTTPTDGDVGTWLFPELPTPATYLLTFEVAGFGTQTIAVDLIAGQQREGVITTLLEGTGRIEGIVTGPDGRGLGGVLVSVTGADEPITTTTLTAGSVVGSYVLTGLPTPGRYAVTFSLDGYSAVTVGVTLADGGSEDSVSAQLVRSTASIIGTVRGPGGALRGAAVELTNGSDVRSTVTADDPAGGYRFDSLPAGQYTMTISLAGFRTRTVLVSVARGEQRTVDATMEATG